MSLQFREPENAAPTVDKKIPYINFPFYDYISYKLKTELISTLNNIFPQIKVQLIFTSKNTIKNILNHKEKLPDSLRSNVVYKYKCDSCSAVYVGSTTRQLFVRTCEHLGISPRTKNRITNPTHSNIREHKENTHHALHSSQFNILAQTNQQTDLRFLESFFIKTLNPSLNTDASAIRTYII